MSLRLRTAAVAFVLLSLSVAAVQREQPMRIEAQGPELWLEAADQHPISITSALNFNGFVTTATSGTFTVISPASGATYCTTTAMAAVQ